MDKKVLKGSDGKQLFLRDGGNSRKKGNPYDVRSRSIRYRRWYRVYLITGISVVVCTLLILCFGVSEFGESFVPWFSPEKLINFVVDTVFGEVNTADNKNDNTNNSAVNNDILNSGNKDNNSNNSPGKPPVVDGKQEEDIYSFDYSLVPDGYTPIIPMDLSLTVYGEGYINNSTGYTPDLSSLLNKELFGNESGVLYSPDKPRVLILHTHSTEAYSENGAIFCESVDSHGRSNNKNESVVSIGKIIADILNENQIWALHCTVMHDSTQYKDSYARAAETIKKYLEKYPSIELVIDVHRDAVIKSSGEIVKAISEVDEKAAAQVMCVVGSDFGGEECPRWEDNLSLALKLRNSLNGSYENICRPVTLKSSTYNQEFAKYSLLLEIGTSGNSYEEAELAAELVANAIVDLLK